MERITGAIFRALLSCSSFLIYQLPEHGHIHLIPKSLPQAPFGKVGLEQQSHNPTSTPQETPNLMEHFLKERTFLVNQGFSTTAPLTLESG